MHCIAMCYYAAETLVKIRCCISLQYKIHKPSYMNIVSNDFLKHNITYIILAVIFQA